MRLERIWAQQEKDRQVADALAKFADMQDGWKGDKAEKGRGPDSHMESTSQKKAAKAGSKGELETSKKAMPARLKRRIKRKQV